MGKSLIVGGVRFEMATRRSIQKHPNLELPSTPPYHLPSTYQPSSPRLDQLQSPHSAQYLPGQLSLHAYRKQQNLEPPRPHSVKTIRRRPAQSSLTSQPQQPTLNSSNSSKFAPSSSQTPCRRQGKALEQLLGKFEHLVVAADPAQVLTQVPLVTNNCEIAYSSPKDSLSQILTVTDW